MSHHFEVQKSAQAYTEHEYDTKQRFISYWHQINEVLTSTNGKLLEIGIGNGFLNRYLRKRDIDVVTLDLDIWLNPTSVGSVTALPFASGAFSVSACFEVLEHIPFPLVKDALYELRRVSQDYVILSIPDTSYSMGVSVHLPKLGERRYHSTFRRFPPMRAPRNIDEHYWEIGVQDFTLRRLAAVINGADLKIRKSYQVYENPYHRFFVCECV